MGSPSEGDAIDRYVVLHPVGRGAMGVVLAAFDPQLDRTIALKLLRPGASPEGQARLQREAQALARVSHPHVIRVHDVGVHHGQVFVAMELVEGSTLAQWLRDRHSWREVLGIFVQAGEGLAAAHAAGLVHRDFKPANVLVGEDGRVKVTDFGLARTHDASCSPPELPSISSPVASDRAATPPDATQADPPRPLGSDSTAQTPTATPNKLTRTGALMGTPAYMSPEQLDGRAADPRSDQFGFCVALYEALAGQRPFDGATPWELASAIEQQRLAVPLPARLPAGVVRALRRGLVVDPSRRHPDMPSLLRALARARDRRRRRASWAAVAMLGAGAWLALQQTDAPDRARYCAQIERRLEGVWDDTVRADAERAFMATELGYAADTWDLVRRRLDRQAGQWVAAQRSVCEAQAALEEEGPVAEREALGRQMICLHRRHAELRQLGQLLQTADAPLVERAPRATEALGSLDACTQVDPGAPPLDSPAALALAEARGAVRVLREAQRNEEAVAAARTTLASLRGAPRALQAEARLSLALALQIIEPDQAEHEFHQAFSDAVASEHDQIALRAALGLAMTKLLHAREPQHYDEAERWTEHARGITVKMGEPPELAVDLDQVQGEIDYRRGDYLAALEHFERALRVREQTTGPDDYRLASCHEDMGRVLWALERNEEALAHQQRSLALEQAHYGPRHPRVATALTSLCGSYTTLGQIDAAIRAGTEAVALLRNAVGSDHPALGAALLQLGTAQSWAGDAENAELSFLGALDNARAAFGDQHRQVALVLNNLGVYYEIEGQLAEAKRYHQQAVTVFTAALGSDHPTTAITMTNLANTMLSGGEVDEAEPLLRAALLTLETRLGAEHPDVALPLVGLAKVLNARDQLRQARPLLERSLALRQPGRAPPEEIATTRYALGTVLWRLGEDRARAILLMTQAYEGYREFGTPEQIEQARAWFAEHGLSEPAPRSVSSPSSRSTLVGPVPRADPAEQSQNNRQ